MPVCQVVRREIRANRNHISISTFATETLAKPCPVSGPRLSQCQAVRLQRRRVCCRLDLRRNTYANATSALQLQLRSGPAPAQVAQPCASSAARPSPWIGPNGNRRSLSSFAAAAARFCSLKNIIYASASEASPAPGAPPSGAALAPRHPSPWICPNDNLSYPFPLCHRCRRIV